ncbi:unnamed protein product [Camellia sinensis]
MMMMMMFELRCGSCYPKTFVGVNAALACIDASIAVLAFYQGRREYVIRKYGVDCIFCDSKVVCFCRGYDV